MLYCRLKLTLQCGEVGARLPDVQKDHDQVQSWGRVQQLLNQGSCMLWKFQLKVLTVAEVGSCIDEA